MPFERYEGIREMLCVIRRPILLSYYIVHTWSLIRNKAIILLLGSMWLKSQIKNKYKAQELYTNYRQGLYRASLMLHSFKIVLNLTILFWVLCVINWCWLKVSKLLTTPIKYLLEIFERIKKFYSWMYPFKKLEI